MRFSANLERHSFLFGEENPVQDECCPYVNAPFHLCRQNASKRKCNNRIIPPPPEPSFIPRLMEMCAYVINRKEQQPARPYCAVIEACLVLQKCSGELASEADKLAAEKPASLDRWLGLESRRRYRKIVVCRTWLHRRYWPSFAKSNRGGCSSRSASVSRVLCGVIWSGSCSFEH